MATEGRINVLDFLFLSNIVRWGLGVITLGISLCVSQLHGTEETASGSGIHFLCVADPLWEPDTPQSLGYSATATVLPGFHSMEFQMILPPTWNDVDCCHRMQIRFDDELISKSLSEGYFIPLLEWTPCSEAIDHVACFGSVGDTTGHKDFDWDGGSWWVTVQQCMRAVESKIKLEIVTFGEGPNILNPMSPRWSWNISVGTFEQSSKLMNLEPAFPRGTICILEGSVHNSQPWQGKVETINTGSLTSLSFHFEFSLSQPSNAEIFTIYFYRAEDLAFLAGQMHCDNSSTEGSGGSGDALLARIRGWGVEEAHKTLALSISNAWSGCRIENQGGRPTYICQGGRNFPSAAGQTRALHIGVSSCADPQRGIDLAYRLELLQQKGSCSGHSEAVYRAAQSSSMESAATRIHSALLCTTAQFSILSLISIYVSGQL